MPSTKTILVLAACAWSASGSPIPLLNDDTTAASTLVPGTSQTLPTIVLLTESSPATSTPAGDGLKELSPAGTTTQSLPIPNSPTESTLQGLTSTISQSLPSIVLLTDSAEAQPSATSSTSSLLQSALDSSTPIDSTETQPATTAAPTRLVDSTGGTASAQTTSDPVQSSLQNDTTTSLPPVTSEVANGSLQSNAQPSTQLDTSTALTQATPSLDVPQTTTRFPAASNATADASSSTAAAASPQAPASGNTTSLAQTSTPAQSPATSTAEAGSTTQTGFGQAVQESTDVQPSVPQQTAINSAPTGDSQSTPLESDVTSTLHSRKTTTLVLYTTIFSSTQPQSTDAASLVDLPEETTTPAAPPAASPTYTQTINPSSNGTALVYGTLTLTYPTNLYSSSGYPSVTVITLPIATTAFQFPSADEQTTSSPPAPQASVEQSAPASTQQTQPEATQSTTTAPEQTTAQSSPATSSEPAAITIIPIDPSSKAGAVVTETVTVIKTEISNVAGSTATVTVTR